MKKMFLLAVAALALAAPVVASSVTVNVGAALNGTSFGLEVGITNPPTDAYVVSDHPASETHYLYRFWLNPNALPIPEGNAGVNHIRFFRVVDGTDGGDPNPRGTFLVGFLTKSQDDHDYHMIFWAKQDGTTAFTSVGNLYVGEENPVNVPVQVEVEFTTADSGTTSLVMKNLNTGQTITRSNLNLGDADVDRIEIGCFTNSNPGGIVGSYDFDEFSSFR